MYSVGITLLASMVMFLSFTGNGSARSRDAVKRSISGWATCDGATDDAESVARAFAAAKHGAFTLVVDCPVRLHIGVDIARTIFIDDGTTVEFTGTGKFTVDNVLHPAFAIANSKDIVLADWNVEYDASLPVDMRTGGYENAAKFVASGANAPPAGAFWDQRMAQWLAANRSIKLDGSRGNVDTLWNGPSNLSAVFMIAGDTSNVRITGMRTPPSPPASCRRSQMARRRRSAHPGSGRSAQPSRMSRRMNQAPVAWVPDIIMTWLGAGLKTGWLRVPSGPIRSWSA